VEANRKKNDVVFIPVGCTELHGLHLPRAAVRWNPHGWRGHPSVFKTRKRAGSQQTVLGCQAFAGRPYLTTGTDYTGDNF
jgi:hypothetical protein